MYKSLDFSSLNFIELYQSKNFGVSKLQFSWLNIDIFHKFDFNNLFIEYVKVLSYHQSQEFGITVIIFLSIQFTSEKYSNFKLEFE